MRILALNYELPPLGGGAGNATAHISRELVRLGCEVNVLTSGFRGLPAEETIDGYRVHRTPVLRRHIDRCSPLEMASFVLSALAPAVRLARRLQPDIVHVYFSIPTGPVAWVTKRLTGAPYLLSLRGGDVPGFLPGSLTGLHRLVAPLNRLVWRDAAVIVANSAGLRDLAQQSTKKPVEMVPNGVDLQRFCPTAASRQNGALRVLFAGRLVRQKGADYLIRAVEQLIRNAQADIELVIVGDGPEEPALRQLTQQLSLTQRVHFAGWVGRDDMPGHYRSADLFVLPSFEEGMPNVVLEALACGLPVIATNIYGNRELVTHGHNGLLIPPGDSEALAQALLTLTREPEARRSMGLLARQRAEAYGWEHTARAYLELSSRALGATAPIDPLPVR